MPVSFNSSAICHMHSPLSVIPTLSIVVRSLAVLRLLNYMRATVECQFHRFESIPSRLGASRHLACDSESMISTSHCFAHARVPPLRNGTFSAGSPKSMT